MKKLFGSHLIFSGMNFVVKNIRGKKEILERIRNQGTGEIKK